MKMLMQVTRKNWLLPFTFLCLIVSGGLTGLLLAARTQTLSLESNLIIDDFSRAADHNNNLIWTYISDQTKEPGKTGGKNFLQNTGRSCLYIKEFVPRSRSLTLLGTIAALRKYTDIKTAGHDGMGVEVDLEQEQGAHGDSDRPHHPAHRPHDHFGHHQQDHLQQQQRVHHE